MKIIRDILMVTCAAVAVLLALVFFSRPEPIRASMPLLTSQMVRENEEKAQEELRKQEEIEAAKRRAALEEKMYRCKADSECVIVDRDLCGCLIGPKGVVAINSEYSFDFSRMMEKKFESMKMCPEEVKAEKECSPSARPACKANRCTIVY